MVISNNTVRNCGGHGILVQGDATAAVNVNITGNIVHNCSQLAPNGYDGIHISAATSVTISDNTVGAGIKYNIGIAAGTVGVAGSGNNLYTPGTSIFNDATGNASISFAEPGFNSFQFFRGTLDITNGGYNLHETASPLSGFAGQETCYGDATAHMPKCSLNGGTAYISPLTGNSAGTHSDSGFYQTASASGCTTAASIGGVCGTATTITWPVAFADANYKVTCIGSGAITNFPIIGSVTTRIAASATVQTMALTAAAASFATIECTAVHN